MLPIGLAGHWVRDQEAAGSNPVTPTTQCGRKTYFGLRIYEGERDVVKKTTSKAAPKKKPEKAQLFTYRLELALKGFAPKIWRHLELPGDTSLRDLHHYTQCCMRWYEAHMYQFSHNDTLALDPDLPDDFMDVDELVCSTANTKIESWLKKKKDCILYEYDFGDGWEVLVTLLEKVVVSRKIAARCVAGERSAPPEDCGGIPGFIELVEAMKRPKSKKSRELTEWLDGPFDLEEFDLDLINQSIKRKPWKQSKF